MKIRFFLYTNKNLPFFCVSNWTFKSSKKWQVDGNGISQNQNKSTPPKLKMEPEKKVHGKREVPY